MDSGLDRNAVAFAQEYDMEQWGSLVEVRAKQEVLEALCLSVTFTLCSRDCTVPHV